VSHWKFHVQGMETYLQQMRQILQLDIPLVDECTARGIAGDGDISKPRKESLLGFTLLVEQAVQMEKGHTRTITVRSETLSVRHARLVNIEYYAYSLGVAIS